MLELQLGLENMARVELGLVKIRISAILALALVLGFILDVYLG